MISALVLALSSIGWAGDMRDKFRNNLFLIAILLVAGIVRLVHLNQSFWLDEAAQALESSRPFTQQFDIVGDFQPPLFHLLVHAFVQVSDAEWWLRLASLVPGLISIYFAYLIAAKMFSQKIGLFTAIFGALSAYHYYFSQELRPYSLAVMLGTMSFYYFHNALKQKKIQQVHWAYIITGSLSLFVTYLTPFLLLTQLFITYLWYKPKFIQVFKHLGFMLIGFLPWLPMFFEQLQAGMGLKAEYAGWSQAVSLPWYKSLPLTGIRFLIGMIRVDLNAVHVILFAVLFSLLGYLSYNYLRQKNHKVIAAWLIGPALFAFIISFIIPVLEPKRLLFSLPALWIILANLLDRLIRRTGVVALLLLLYSLPLFIHFVDPSLKREDWKSSTQFINANAGLNSAVLFAFPSPFAPYQWYGNPSIPTISTKVLTVPNEIYLNEVIKNALLYDQVFVYEYLMDLSDPNRLIFNWLEKNGFQEILVQDFHGVGFVHVFQKSHPVAKVYE